MFTYTNIRTLFMFSCKTQTIVAFSCNYLTTFGMYKFATIFFGAVCRFYIFISIKNNMFAMVGILISGVVIHVGWIHQNWIVNIILVVKFISYVDYCRHICRQVIIIITNQRTVMRTLKKYVITTSFWLKKYLILSISTFRIRQTLLEAIVVTSRLPYTFFQTRYDAIIAFCRSAALFAPANVAVWAVAALPKGTFRAFGSLASRSAVTAYTSQTTVILAESLSFVMHCLWIIVKW